MNGSTSTSCPGSCGSRARRAAHEVCSHNGPLTPPYTAPRAGAGSIGAGDLAAVGHFRGDTRLIQFELASQGRGTAPPVPAPMRRNRLVEADRCQFRTFAEPASIRHRGHTRDIDSPAKRRHQDPEEPPQCVRPDGVRRRDRARERPRQVGRRAGVAARVCRYPAGRTRARRYVAARPSCSGQGAMQGASATAQALHADRPSLVETGRQPGRALMP